MEKKGWPRVFLFSLAGDEGEGSVPSITATDSRDFARQFMERFYESERFETVYAFMDWYGKQFHWEEAKRTDEIRFVEALEEANVVKSRPARGPQTKTKTTEFLRASSKRAR